MKQHIKIKGLLPKFLLVIQSVSVEAIYQKHFYFYLYICLLVVYLFADLPSGLVSVHFQID